MVHYGTSLTGIPWLQTLLYPLKHATPQLLPGQCLATESTEAATAFGCIPLIMERSDVKAFF
jgi:hypothetical protein